MEAAFKAAVVILLNYGRKEVQGKGKTEVRAPQAEGELGKWFLLRWHLERREKGSWRVER